MSRSLFIVIASVMVGGCVTSPSHVLDLMDADTDSEIESAAGKACEFLVSREHEINVRKAAAKTLGRLRFVSPDVTGKLALVLTDESEDPELRAFSAWALGELRSEQSLVVLVRSLRVSMDQRTGQFVLDALAKHYAFLSRDQDRLVEVVEAMVYFAGNQQGRPPAIYDVLGAHTRTVPVNVRVLERAIEEVMADKNDTRRLAAMYNATYELLERLDGSRDEILAGGSVWQVQLDAAVKQTHRAIALEDARTQALALWYLGRLAELRDVASPAAEVLVGAHGDLAKRPSIAPSTALRLIAAWTLARMQLYAPGPRQALVRDVLPRELERAVLEVLADLSSRSDDHDQLQKLLGVEDTK